VTETVDPAGHGAGRVEYFTVLYDEGCPICRAAHRWLGGRAQLVPLFFVAAGSAEARLRFPGLDHAATLRDLTVITDGGLVYVSDGAWLACLWALADYRGMAERLGSPRLLPTARRFIAAAAAVRESTRSGDQPAGAGDYGDGCDDQCR
jgi:predicted DCC family thiol-disulfide oxidoreductase YuxK